MGGLAHEANRTNQHNHKEVIYQPFSLLTGGKSHGSVVITDSLPLISDNSWDAKSHPALIPGNAKPQRSLLLVYHDRWESTHSFM